ncbi:MAG: beta strand repeat-containing protein, partial [Desulfobaccales bacterium]
LPGSFGLSLTGSETSPWSFSYLPNQMGDVNSTMQGVVSGTSGSTLTGAMTVFPNNPDTPFSSSLVSSLQPNPYLFPMTWMNDTVVSSINIQPDGSATGTAYDTYFKDGRFISATMNLTQTPFTSGTYTPTSATYNFTQTYNGALMANINNNMRLVGPGDVGVNGFGWGLRSGTGTTGGVEGGAVLNYNGYFAAYDNGVWAGAASALPSNYNGSSLTTGISGPGAVTQMSGSVSGTLGHNLTGSMTWIGSLLNGPSFSYSGPVTISSDGSLQFAYGNGTYASSGGSYSSNWTMGGLNGTATGTLNEYPGYKFTQTMTGNSYQVSLNNPSNGTLTISNNTTAGGSRSGVYGGSIGPFSGTFNLWSSPPNSLPFSSLSGTSISLTLDGVAGTSELGAITSAPSTLQLTSTDFPGLSMTVPGMVGLSPGGGTYFTAPGVLVQNSSGTPFAVGSFTSSTTLPSPLAQTPLYYFSESYQGFRLSTLGASPNLANIEGYGFGVRGSSVDNPSGAAALPANYLGAFLAQDLGTRASATSLSSNMVSLSGSLTATLSGTLGQTLTGQGLFTGTNSAGVAFSYQGNVTLAANGQLVFNYAGSWNSTTSSQTGTGSGTIQQIPGTLFTETVTGTYQQASTSTPLGTNYPTGTNLAVTTFKDATPLTGTRTVGDTTTSTTGSYAGMIATVNPAASGASTGSGSLTVQGVVAATSPQSQWGVATATATYTPSGGSPTTLPVTAGTVTIDPSGTLTGQFVNTTNSGTSTANPANNLTQNYASVPTSAGLTTASYTQTASGTFNSVATADGSGKTVTTPTPLTGTSTGVLAGPVNSDLAITSTALQPNAYSSGSGAIATTTVGVVAGPSGGTQTGVSTVQAVKTSTSGATTLTSYVGATTLTPAVAPAVSPTLTTTLQGVNPATPGGSLVGATQTGTLTVTK